MWNNKWWHKSKWRSWVNLSDDKFEKLINVLMREFDDVWVQSLGENVWKHPLSHNACGYGEGIPQLSYLLRIAGYINDLSNIHGFYNVLKDYKSLQYSKAAELELFLAHVLYKSGYKVSFVIPKPKKGRTPDILVECDDGEFVVECKFLDDVSGERWFNGYRTHFAMNILKEIPPEKALLYFPANEYINIWSYGYPNKLGSYKISAYIDSMDIVNTIKMLKLGFHKSALVDVHNKGTIVWLDKTKSVRSEINLPELNHRFLNKRLICNGVNKANLQIADFNIPGIAAIFQSNPVHEADLKSVLHNLFEENRDIYSKLMAVLVFPAQNILKYIEPILVENPYSELSLDNFNIKEAIYPLLQYKV